IANHRRGNGAKLGNQGVNGGLLRQSLERACPGDKPWTSVKLCNVTRVRSKIAGPALLPHCQGHKCIGGEVAGALPPDAPSPGAYETVVGSSSPGSGLEAVLPPWCSTTSAMMSSSVRVGVQPISAWTLAMSGTRRNMSSKPSP